MYSRHHLALSVVVGAALAATVAPATPPARLGTVCYAAALGVGIDVDHLLLARANAGDWRTLRRGLANPRLLVVDQSSLFEAGEVYGWQRLTSHLLIAGPLAVGAWLLAPWLGVATAATLYVHLLADAAWESRRSEGAWPWER